MMQLIDTLPPIEFTNEDAAMRLVEVWSLKNNWIVERFYQHLHQRYTSYLPYFGDGDFDEFMKTDFNEFDEMPTKGKADAYSPYYFSKTYDGVYRRLSIASTPTNLTDLDEDECLFHINLYPKRQNKDFEYPLFATEAIYRAELLCLKLMDYLALPNKPFQISAVGFRNTQQIKEKMQIIEDAELIETVEQTYHRNPSLFFIVKNFSELNSQIFDFERFAQTDDSFEIDVKTFHKSKAKCSINLAELIASDKRQQINIIQNAKPHRWNDKTMDEQRFPIKADALIHYRHIKLRGKASNWYAFYSKPTFDSEGNKIFSPIPFDYKNPPSIGNFHPIDGKVITFGKMGKDDAKMSKGSVNIYNATNKLLDRINEKTHLKTIFQTTETFLERSIAKFISSSGLEGYFESRQQLPIDDVNISKLRLKYEIKLHPHIIFQNTEKNQIPFFLPPKIADNRERSIGLGWIKYMEQSVRVGKLTTHSFHLKHPLFKLDADETTEQTNHLPI